MSESKDKKSGPNFSDAVAAAKAAKLAKKAQAKKDRADDAQHASNKPAFKAQTPMHKQGAYVPRITSRAKKG